MATRFSDRSSPPAARSAARRTTRWSPTAFSALSAFLRTQREPVPQTLLTLQRDAPCLVDPRDGMPHVRISAGLSPSRAATDERPVASRLSDRLAFAYMTVPVALLLLVTAASASVVAA